MTKKEFKDLSTGDIVRGWTSGQVFIVTANYGDHVTAVKVVDMTNPADWSLVAKATLKDTE